MPPDGKPRPDKAAYDGTIAYLESSIDRVDVMEPNPGRTEMMRRLTRTEYRNVIRDLLALDIDVSSLLPKDDSSHGFDNITVGELSPILFERYLSAAKKISRLALGRPVGSPQGTTLTLPLDLTQDSHIEGLPLGTRGGAVVQHTFPQNGDYELQLQLTRNRNEKVEGLNRSYQLELLLDGSPVQSFQVRPPERGENHDHVDRHLKVRIPVQAGPHELAATFIRQTSALSESERQPYLAHFNADRHPRSHPALYSITVVGPFDASGPGNSPSRRLIFSCYPSDSTEEDRCARTILSTLIRRAYRRPIDENDLRTPMQFYRETKDQEGFEAGIEMALRAILVNPHFLFRIEKTPTDIPPDTAYPLSQIDLASRLSFFLWSSLPSDELLEKAVRGDLRNPDVLEKQVRNMLADRRSDSMVNNFAVQWLYLRNLNKARPDARLFPDYDDNLRQAMRRETDLFLLSIVREDQSILDLLRADYTFVNERLAKHYDIPNIYGSRFRRISLDRNETRGGLLSHGSILTVTSYPNRTSPVVRGKWILENILGIPPKPPPPDVPELKENSDTQEFLTVRERLAEHRQNRSCARCHNLMDPVGFALENYDAIGRWRTVDDGIEIDASGSLLDGSRFDGANELQQALLNRPELFVRTVTEKLLTYALGRGLEYYDAPAIRKIVNDARRENYRFSALILGIVKSTPFQMRKSL
jgi:hypothetical protein